MSVWLVTVALLTEVAIITAALVAMALDQLQWLPSSLTVVAGSVLFGGLGGCT